MEKRWIRWVRGIVATIGFAGGLAFAAANVWSFADPLGVERMAREAIRVEVQKRVEFQIDTLDAGGLSAIAQRFAAAERERMERLKAQLREGLAERVSAAIAKMLDADCECRKKVAVAVDDWFAGMIQAGERAVAGLDNLIRQKYQDVAASLLREFRIFTATNAFVLLLMGAAVLIKRRAGVHLLPAALLVVLASGGVSWAYLFNQDWLHTILFGDYMGLWFVGYVVLATLLLFDIAFNKARVTTEILNAVFSAIGSISPC